MQVQKVQQSSISSKWESLLNNLGHTARKLGKLEDALKYHQQALVLKPKSSSTYSAIPNIPKRNNIPSFYKIRSV